MIKQKINLVVDWLLSMRKRLSEALKTVGNMCSQKVQHLYNFIETSEITKLVRKFVGIEKKPKKTIKKKATAKKKTTASKK